MSGLQPGSHPAGRPLGFCAPGGCGRPGLGLQSCRWCMFDLPSSRQCPVCVLRASSRGHFHSLHREGWCDGVTWLSQLRRLQETGPCGQQVDCPVAAACPGFRGECWSDSLCFLAHALDEARCRGHTDPGSGPARPLPDEGPYMSLIPCVRVLLSVMSRSTEELMPPQLGPRHGMEGLSSSELLLSLSLALIVSGCDAQYNEYRILKGR